MKKKNSVEIVERVAFVLFIISIYLAVRWSDFPVIKCVLFDNPVFVHSQNVDSSLLNIVTGYFSGYLVYILTVVIPTRKKTKIAMWQVSARLSVIYNEFISTLLLMAKSAATESEWKHILNHDKDLECFDSVYYSVMRRFDITVEAETMFKKPNGDDAPVTLSWIEYLEMKMESWYEELDDVFLRYQMYMPDNLTKCIYRIKTNGFFEMILGKGIGMESFYVGEDGTEYCESIPISKFIMQVENKVAPVFGINHGVDGLPSLKDCIQEFSYLYGIIRKNIKDKRSEPDCSLNKFKKHNIGHIGTARLVVPEPNADIKQ